MYIAIVLSHKKLKADEAYKRLISEVIHYTNISPDIIITHCSGTHPHIICLPFHPSNALQFFLFILRIYSIIISRIRKIHGIIAWGSLLAIFMLPFRFLGKRLTIVQLGDWPRVIYWKVYYRYGIKFARDVERILRIAERVTFILSNNIITNAPQVVKIYKWRKVSFIPPPIPTSTTRSSRSSGHKHNICLACISRLDYEKGIYRLIKAYLKALRKTTGKICDLFIIGSGPLEEKIRQISLRTHKIKYVGFVRRQELLKEIYRKIYALIIASHTEGFPLVLIEATLCGVPVIIVSNELDDTLKRMANIVFSNENELVDILIRISKWKNHAASEECTDLK